MSEPVTYSLHNGVATITMDDGKANLMTMPMTAALSAAFTRAQTDGAVVVITGRERLFSAGYDTAVFQLSIEEIVATMRAGGELVHQIFCHPLPVVAACNGHAIAQGAFVLLACNVRLGVPNGAKVGLNEVAIGLTIPHYGVEMARHALAPAWFDRATITGTLFDAERAERAGFLHELVPADELLATAIAHAHQLTKLDMNAHDETKQRVRRTAGEIMATSIRSEFPTS